VFFLARGNNFTLFEDDILDTHEKTRVEFIV
jgi:hypothetical protein